MGLGSGAFAFSVGLTFFGSDFLAGVSTVVLVGFGAVIEGSGGAGADEADDELSTLAELPI